MKRDQHGQIPHFLLCLSRYNLGVVTNLGYPSLLMTLKAMVKLYSEHQRQASNGNGYPNSSNFSTRKSPSDIFLHYQLGLLHKQKQKQPEEGL